MTLPGQTPMFEELVVPPKPIKVLEPLTVSFTISLHRTPRLKCTACGRRRICYYVGLDGLVSSPPMCATCAGIR